MTAGLPRNIPESARALLEFMRDVRIVSNNQTVSGTRKLGSFYGVLTPKMNVIQDHVGGAVVTSSHEAFIQGGVPGLQEGDNARSLADGSRFKVVKVFNYPGMTAVWLEKARAL